MVRDPRVFLMDEPLSNLDAKLRVTARAEIAELHRRSGVACIYVTHDQVEAMTMSDRVALMMGGEVLQVAPPAEIYDRPAELRVAEFIGSPKINVLPGTVRGDGGVDVPRRACHPQRPSPPTPSFPSACAPNIVMSPRTQRPTASAARSASRNLGSDLFVHVETVGRASHHCQERAGDRRRRAARRRR